MTAAEQKAKEIVIKMQFQKRALMFEDAKQCALIAVDEILNNKSIIKTNWDINYWNEVKTEIEKL